MRRRAPLFLGPILMAWLALTACGSDKVGLSSVSSGSSLTRSPSPSPSADGTSDSVSAPPSPRVSSSASAAPRGPQQCAQQRTYRIKIVLGDVACDEAYDVAFRVDEDGEKRQDVDGYVCEFGTAATRPTAFTCTDRSHGAEFAVDEP